MLTLQLASQCHCTSQQVADGQGKALYHCEPGKTLQQRPQDHLAWQKSIVSLERYITSNWLALLLKICLELVLV